MRDDLDEIKAGMLEERERTGSVDIAAWLERIAGFPTDVRGELIDFAFWVEQIRAATDVLVEEITAATDVPEATWTDEGGVAQRALSELLSKIPRSSREAVSAAAALRSSMAKNVEEVAARMGAASDHLARILEREEQLAIERQMVLARIKDVEEQLAIERRAVLAQIKDVLAKQTALRHEPVARYTFAEETAASYRWGFMRAESKAPDEEQFRVALAHWREAATAQRRALPRDAAAADRAALRAWVFHRLSEGTERRAFQTEDVATLLERGLGFVSGEASRKSEINIDLIAREHDWFDFDVHVSHLNPRGRFQDALQRAHAAFVKPAVVERFLDYLIRLPPAEVYACAWFVREDAQSQWKWLSAEIATLPLRPAGSTEVLKSALAEVGRIRVRDRLERLGLLE